MGPAEHCVELLQAYADAGAHQVLLWPIADPINQLELFTTQVRTHLDPA
ncbi:hypothetical protein [Nocardiopsis oceani]